MKVFVLRLTADQLQVVSAALSELPFRVVAPVISDINDQLQKQQSIVAAVNSEKD